MTNHASNKKGINALRRKIRTRARISGTARRPRLSVKRGLRSLYVQLIDDDRGVTLVGVSDGHLEKKAALHPVERAREVGRLVAEQAGKLDITEAVFDRGSYRYHGRVAAVADGARERGLKV